MWHNWAVAHVLSSLLWLVSGLFHIKRHWHWYRSITSKGIGRKSRITLALSAAFLVVTVTGIILIAYVDGANSAIGLWHYKFGLLLIVFSLVHCIKRKRKRCAPPQQETVKRVFPTVLFISGKTDPARGTCDGGNGIHDTLITDKRPVYHSLYAVGFIPKLRCT